MKNLLRTYIEKAHEKNNGVQDIIVDVFSSGKKIDDKKDVHAAAEKLGMVPDDFEEKIYQFMTDFFSGGKFMKSGKKEGDFDPKEIEMGLKVESEHVNNPIIQKRIALDHLSENPTYYSNGKKLGIFDELK
jgi:hypothetical protein